MVISNKIVGRIVELLERFPWVIPAFGFVSGVASFFLVERKQDQFAQLLSILMLVGWVWLSLEKLLQRGISHWFNIEVPPSLLRFVSQLLHQESLFFVIPFFFITTSWNSGQLVFTSLLIVSAFVSIVDPLYYKWLAPRPWLYTIFHGITLFAVLLVALPLIFHLQTPQSYLWSLAIAVFLSLFGMAREMKMLWWKRILVIVLLMATTCGVGFLVRPWIPPASIWLTEVAITDHMDNESRSAQNKLEIVTEQQLRNGIYAYTSIHAPRGLNERIYHQWKHNGKPFDKIALNIKGGREEGYRAWTHKVNFPQDALGSWQIYVVTEAQQVIGVLRFQVVDSLPAVDSAAPASSPPALSPPESSTPESSPPEPSSPELPQPDAPASSPSELPQPESLPVSEDKAKEESLPAADAPASPASEPAAEVQ